MDDIQKNFDPIHLGDGAYLHFDGNAFVFTANHHNPELATDTVSVDAWSTKQLREYLDKHLTADSGSETWHQQ